MADDRKENKSGQQGQQTPGRQDKEQGTSGQGKQGGQQGGKQGGQQGGGRQSGQQSNR